MLNAVVADNAVARLVGRRARAFAVVTRYQDADIVIVMNITIAYPEAVDVPINRNRFAISGFVVVNFTGVNKQVGN